jgi:formate dehydrogenase subunit delta
VDPENLISMANRIGQFFEAYPDREEARREVANHIGRFWEPRMRRALYDGLDRGLATDLLPLVSEALEAHRAILTPGVTTP